MADVRLQLDDAGYSGNGDALILSISQHCDPHSDVVDFGIEYFLKEHSIVPMLSAKAL